MRNLIISTIVSLFLFFLMTGIGVAADNDNILDSTDAATASIDFNVSKNITVTYNVTANQDGFTTISSHKQGDTLYGAGSDSTLVFKDDSGTKVKGTDYVTLPTSDNTTAAFGDGTVDGKVGNWLPM